MQKFVSVLVLSMALVTGSCATHGSADDCADCAKAQSVVGSVAKTNADVTRLSLHSAMGGDELLVCASTHGGTRGSRSDAEHRQAVATNQTVVRDEPGAIDVTVPTHVRNGRPMAVCSVTLKTTGTTREQAIAKATTIARSVEAGIPRCCDSCGK